MLTQHCRFRSDTQTLHFWTHNMPSDHQKRLNRDKQRRFRAKHAAKLRTDRQRQALVRETRPPGPRPSWYVADLLDPDGLDGVPLDTVVYQEGDGRALSHRWTPRVAMPLKVALRVMRARREQVRAWAGL